MIKELEPISVNDVKLGKQSSGKQDNPEKDKKELLAGKPVKDVLGSIKIEKVKEKMQEATKPTEQDYLIIMEQYLGYWQNKSLTADQLTDMELIESKLKESIKVLKDKTPNEIKNFCIESIKSKSIKSLNEDLTADEYKIDVLQTLRDLQQARVGLVSFYETSLLRLKENKEENLQQGTVLEVVDTQLKTDKSLLSEIDALIKQIDGDIPETTEMSTEQEVIDLDAELEKESE